VANVEHARFVVSVVVVVVVAVTVDVGQQQQENSHNNNMLNNSAFIARLFATRGESNFLGKLPGPRVGLRPMPSSSSSEKVASSSTQEKKKCFINFYR